MGRDFGPQFMVADECEATSGADSVPLDGVPRAGVDPEGLYGVGPECLAQLHCLVLGLEYDINVLDGYEEVYAWDEMHGPWLIRLPNEFVDGLAALDTQKILLLAQQWLKASYGFRLNEAPQSWVEKTVAKLAQLARQAIQHNKRMYWEAPSC